MHSGYDSYHMSLLKLRSKRVIDTTGEFFWFMHMLIGTNILNKT